VTVPQSNLVFGICRELRSFHTKCGLAVDSTAVALVSVVSYAFRVFRHHCDLELHMRPLWSGALTFGLVNIPVRLHSAVQAKERVSFRLLHKKDLSPIRYERVCQKEGEAVDWKDIVKGYEYTKGKFVVLTDDDFKAAAIESSKTIEIMDFVKSDEVDARYFETPYYVVPAKGGEKAYALLREAIKRTGMVGIGKITMRTNSLHLAGVKAVGEALVLEIMRFEEELVDLTDLTLPSDTNVRPQELQMAEQLVGNLS